MARTSYVPPTEEEFEAMIEARDVGIPNCRRSKKMVIKSGPKSYKWATILEFAKGDGIVTSRRMTLNTFEFERFGGIDFRAKNRLAQWNCNDREIEKLRAFLNAVDEVQQNGRHTVIPQSHADSFKAFMEKLGDSDLTTPQLLDLIQALSERAADIRNLPQLGESNKLRMVAAAIRVAHRQQALSRLQELIAEDALEGDVQSLLEQNWWMFGCHYIEQIERRRWTTDEAIDILLRSADGFFELIELKRSGAPIFKKDHGKWVVSSAVSDGVNQAAHYISEIERIYPALLQRYKVDLYRLKAKVLIGYLESDEDEVEEKRAALRLYNSHLHRIEVITFDGLVRIAQNVIDANAGECGQDDLEVEGTNAVAF